MLRKKARVRKFTRRNGFQVSPIVGIYGELHQQLADAHMLFAYREISSGDGLIPKYRRIQHMVEVSIFSILRS